MKIFIVLIATIVVLSGLQWAFTFGLCHNMNLKMPFVAASPRNAGLLVHGPCEPLWMVSPALIDPVAGVRSYNLAAAHSDFADNFLALHLYLKHNHPPHTLLLYVTPESFDPRYNTFNSFAYAPYLDDDTVRAVIRECDPPYYRWIYVPFMRYGYYNRQLTFEALQGWLHFMRGRTQAYYPDGFEPPTQRVWGNHMAEFAVLYEKDYRFVIDPLRVKYFFRLIGIARSRGIRVILYESPVFREALAWQPNRDVTVGRIDSLAEIAGVPYVRFDSVNLGTKKDLYISTLSFNVKGVRLFNDTLARWLRANIKR